MLSEADGKVERGAMEFVGIIYKINELQMILWVDAYSFSRKETQFNAI